MSLIIMEVCTNLYAGNDAHLFWSIYALISLSVITVFFAVAGIVEYIRKNTFLSPQYVF